MQISNCVQSNNQYTLIDYIVSNQSNMCLSVASAYPIYTHWCIYWRSSWQKKIIKWQTSQEIINVHYYQNGHYLFCSVVFFKSVELPICPIAASKCFYNIKRSIKKWKFAFLCCLGNIICSTICAENDDISQCASSAADGHQAWSDLTCHQRANVLLRYR